jgi:predicted dehydrogenase
MGRHHARVLGSLEGVDLVAAADPNGDPYGVVPREILGSSLQDVIAAGVDYCVLAVPTALHEENAMALAEAGVHVLVEKPLAPDVAAAERMASAFEEQGLVGAVGHIERYNPALSEARRRMEQGQLGSVLQIVTRRQGPFPLRIGDVGVVMDLATHDIDLTAWIAQSPFVSVAARVAHRSGRVHEDLVSVVGSLGSGIVTNHLVNWLSPFKERVTVITGEKGAFVADTVAADLTFYANGTVETQWDAVAGFRGVSEGDVVRFAIAKPEPLRSEHEAFRDVVRGVDATIVTMREGLATVEVAEAMLHSSCEGSTVKVARRSSA